jgi:hypothetical protein
MLLSKHIHVAIIESILVIDLSGTIIGQSKISDFFKQKK